MTIPVSQDDRLRRLERRAQREQLARRSAEDLLEQKSREVFDANRRLALLNEELETRVRERTDELERERQRAMHLAERDYLTQLANRHLFDRRIEQNVEAATASNESFALILIDLDGFKVINDTYGHAAGDAVLKSVADRIRKIVGENDLVARLGGDEFAVLLQTGSPAIDIDDITLRLLDALHEPILFGRRRLVCGASLGLAHCPEHSDDTDELQVFADLALYHAKQLGRGASVTFERRMAEQFRLRRALGAELEKALDEERIDVFFQPIVDLDSRSLVGFEGLLRWFEPERGWIPPMEALSIARDRSLLGRLTRQVVRKCLKSAAPALRSGRAKWVAFNLADYDLGDRDLPDYILRTCSAVGVDPRQLKIEITEHTVISDTDRAGYVMELLNDFGMRFAIDDFGTGYSNLLTLNRLPFQTLKIDRTFVAELFENSESRTIVSAMINLAHALGLNTTAEGVETVQQSETLRALGCDLAQGYLFGGPRPMPELLDAQVFANLDIRDRGRESALEDAEEFDPESIYRTGS